MRGADMKLSNTSRLPTNLQRLPCGIECGDICAKENDGITIDSASQGHLDAVGSIGGGCNFDSANSACSTETSGSETQGIDAPLAVVTDGIGCEVGNDDSNGNTLDAGIDNGDRKGGAAVIVKWPCSSCHKSTSCGVKPIDWSALENKQINDDYDRGAA